MIQRVKPLKLSTSEVNIFFTSDTHFGHKNILNFCERPFKDTDEMDETIITNWNNKVGKNDIVFHLGDFAFATNKRWQELQYKLNGKIYMTYYANQANTAENPDFQVARLAYCSETDTSDMTIEEVIAAIIAICDSKK